MNKPSYLYGTKVDYINADGSITPIVAERQEDDRAFCRGCVFNATEKCQQAPDCGLLIWKEAV